LVFGVFDNVATRRFWEIGTPEGIGGIDIAAESEVAKARRVVVYDIDGIGRSCWIIRLWNWPVVETSVSTLVEGVLPLKNTCESGESHGDESAWEQKYRQFNKAE
jgi:hypothetical protein